MAHGKIALLSKANDQQSNKSFCSFSSQVETFLFFKKYLIRTCSRSSAVLSGTLIALIEKKIKIFGNVSEIFVGKVSGLSYDWYTNID